MEATQQIETAPARTDTDLGSGTDATARLDAAVRFGLALPDAMELSDIAYGEIEEWDSVAHMQLVAAIEAEFGILIDTDDVIAMSDYATVRRLLRDHHGIALDS